MNEIKVFQNEQFGQLRAMLGHEGEPSMMGTDVAKRLGYKNPSNALQVHVDEEDKTSYLIQVSGSTYKANTLVINESGLYSLILSSCTQRRSALPLATASYVLIQIYLVNII